MSELRNLFKAGFNDFISLKRPFIFNGKWLHNFIPDELPFGTQSSCTLEDVKLY